MLLCNPNIVFYLVCLYETMHRTNKPFFLHDDGPNLIKQHFYLITLDSITHSDTYFNVPGYVLTSSICSNLNPTDDSPACTDTMTSVVIRLLLISNFPSLNSSISTWQPILPEHLIRKTLDLQSWVFIRFTRKHHCDSQAEMRFLLKVSL